MSAVSHIQKTAPAPPNEIAATTPAKLPIPTRVAVATISAWTPDIEFSSFFASSFSSVTRIISGNRRNGRNLVLNVKYKPAGIRINTRRERPNWTSPPENSRIIKSPHNRSLIAPTSLMIMWSIRLMRYTSFCNVWIEVHVASNRQGPLTCLARSYICSNRWRLVLQMMFDAWCVMHHISCNSYNTLFCTKVNGYFKKNYAK